MIGPPGLSGEKGSPGEAGAPVSTSSTRQTVLIAKYYQVYISL